jgi:fermentation-respiration switch protein FrsA (DUF1100 family)
MLTALSLLYFTRNPFHIKKSPSDYGITSFENITVVSVSRKGKKLNLHGLWISAIKKPVESFGNLFSKKNNKATIVVTHGHGSNIRKLDRKSDSLFVKGILPFYYAGFNVLALDLRNHGKSRNSKPITFGYYESDDILAAIDWIKIKAQNDKTLDTNKIAIWGESMGAATTIFAASKDVLNGNIKAIICDSPFSEFKSPFKYKLKRLHLSFLYRWISFWFNLFSPIKLRDISPINHICSIKIPILLIHGKNDKTIPFNDSELLVKKAQSQNSEVPSIEFIVHDFDHVQSFKIENHYTRLVSFMTKNLFLEK